MVNFSINGFGRIGRCVVRIWLKDQLQKSDLRAINTSGSMNVAGWAYLLKYDTTYGVLPYPISSEEIQTPDKITDENPLLGYITIEHPLKTFKIPVLAQRDPAKIPWGQYGADVVIESTGAFTKLEKAQKHTILLQLMILIKLIHLKI